MKILSVKLKSIVITALVIIAVVLGIFFTASTLSDAVSAEARMIPIYSVDTPENKVAVTFNCAVGNSDIDSILAMLDECNVKATFFLLGSWADDYIEEVQKIYDAGHEIGNHSYSHKKNSSVHKAINNRPPRCSSVVCCCSSSELYFFTNELYRSRSNALT